MSDFLDDPLVNETPDKIRKYHVYQYHHLDDLRFMPSAEEVLASLANKAEIIETVQSIFKENGWEGDGEITVMWLPPFTTPEFEDSHGTIVYHVKQSNNGTSWLASPIPLPFESVLDQN